MADFIIFQWNRAEVIERYHNHSDSHLKFSRWRISNSSRQSHAGTFENHT